MHWLTCLLVTATAVVEVRLTTLDGQAVTGQLQGLGADGAQLQVDAQPRTIALDQIVSIERTEEVAQRRTAGRVGLAGGSRLLIEDLVIADDAAELTLRGGHRLSVPLKRLDWIRFRSSSDAVDAQWLGLIERPRSADTLVVRRSGDAIDEVAGVVLGVDDEVVHFSLDGEAMRAPRTRLEGVVLASSPDAESAVGGEITIDDIAGSRWLATSLGPANDGELTIELAPDLSHRLPLQSIRKIELSGSVDYLVDHQPLSAQFRPAVSLGLQDGLLGGWLGPETAGRDLLLRAKSHIEYHTAEGMETLVGSVDFDERVDAGTSCLVRVLLDGEAAWEHRLDVEDGAPRGFELPLAGVRRIRLEVEADGADLGNTVRFRQLRMQK